MAEAEVKELMMADKNILLTQRNAPIIGLVQDALIGAYLMTDAEEEVSWRQFFDTIMVYHRPSDGDYSTELASFYARAETYYPHLFSDGVPAKDTKCPGRVLISLSFPSDFFYTKKNEKDIDEPVVIIENGILIAGRLDKTVIGIKANSVIHKLAVEYGTSIAAKFIDRANFIINAYLTGRGFSIGIGDCLCRDRSQIDETLARSKIKCSSILEGGHNARAERKILAELNSVSAVGQRVTVKGGLLGGSRNRIAMCVASGAKGNFVNISQIAAIVGQQNVEGKRVAPILSEGRRSLPHFECDDLSPAAGGFVEHNYLEGLTPEETFMHAMAGREGVIDTAVKSVIGETPIVIIENGKTKRVLIGEWIDELLKEKSGDVEYYELVQRVNMELLHIEDRNAMIPTVNSKGNVSWGKISAVTRHDPGEALYEILTLGGRSVTVTEAQSLLVWNEETQEFKRKSTPSVVVGDFVPTTIFLPEYIGVHEFNIITASAGIIEKFLDEVLIEGNITENFVELEPISKKMIEKLSIICSRLGIFTEISSDTLTIRRDWEKRFRKQNDVVLDKIIKITKIGVNDHPKVYDLTVPSTLNFSLANGLHVVDTADTGYIERKIGKKCEDCVLREMGTIKDATGNIIQFLYGGDGLDPSKLCYISGEKEPFFIDVFRVIQRLNCESVEPMDLSEKEIENIVEGISVHGAQTKPTLVATENIRERLSSHLKRIKVCPDVFERFKKEIIDAWWGIIACEGESVGMLATSSIGEPTTQSSLRHNERVVYSSPNGIVSVSTFSEFIDPFFDECKSSDTEVADVNGYKVLSVTKDEKVVWSEISQVSRHPSNGDLIKITTQSGRTVTATLSHSFLKRSPEGIVEQLGKNLRIGDDVPVLERVSLDHIVWEEITEIEIIPDPHENVYDLTVPGTQTFATANGIFVHNTLNSVEWSEEIVIYKSGSSHLEKIGSWIDDLLDNNESLIEKFSENRTEYLDLTKTKQMRDIYIPSVDKGGAVSWCHISAITRHLPVGDLVKVTTFSGRTVTATQSKSFLVWNGTELIQTPGKDVRVGDQVPITRYLESPEILSEGLNLERFLPKDKWIYGTDLYTAINIRKEYKLRGKALSGWWKNHYGISFTLPFHSLGNAMNSIKRRVIMSGFIYPPRGGVKSHIPEVIEFDELFGFFVGIYLAEGSINEKNSFISIANRREKVEKFADKFNITVTKGTILHSNILAIIFRKWIGVGSEKRVPPEAFGASVCFVKGILDGYFSGDGTINTKDISFSLASENMVKGISFLCSRMGLFTLSIRNIWNCKRGYEIVEGTDIILDRVVSIEFMVSDKEYVYDLTVPSTTNFCMANGLGMADTFHMAGGEKNVTLGVPRLMELLGASKKPKTPGCTVYINNPTKRKLEKLANASKCPQHIKNANKLKFLKYISDIGRIERILCKDVLAEDPIMLWIGKEMPPISEVVRTFYIYDKFIEPWWFKFSNSKSVEPQQWVVELKFDPQKLYYYQITLKTIAVMIDEYCNISVACVISPQAIATVIVIVDMNVITKPAEKLLDNEAIVRLDNLPYFVTRDLVIPSIQDTVIQGIEKIQKTYLLQVGDEWVIDTQGSNLNDLLSQSYVDSTRTVSDDMWDIYNVLGIEAARKFLVDEFIRILCFDGGYINIRHVELLVDVMTHKGTITPAARYGIDRSVGPIAKGCFEKSVQNFVVAAIYGEDDPNKGMSARIATGSLLLCGTGVVETDLTEEYKDLLKSTM